jgi:transaldolase
MSLRDLKIKIFADGAEINAMIQIYKEGLIKGLTTNPSLMRKGGVSDYPKFAKEVLAQIKDLPISFEVFTDDFASMEREAHAINAWGPNVYVKIPVTNTKGESSLPLVSKLAKEGIKLNVTAILTLDQVKGVVSALEAGVPSIVSVFAGRIADTGRDPIPMMTESLKICGQKAGCELLWASTRELLNLFQAEAIGCPIITVPNDILKKAVHVGMDLTAMSLDTVQMFSKDAAAAGFKIV